MPSPPHILRAVAFWVGLWHSFWSLAESIIKLRELRNKELPGEIFEPTRRGVEIFARAIAIALAGLLCYLLMLEISLAGQSIGIVEAFELLVMGAVIGVLTMVWISESITVLTRIQTS